MPSRPPDEDNSDIPVPTLPKKPRKPRQDYRNHPWTEIEMEFIRGTIHYDLETGRSKIDKPTLQKLSDKYGIPIESIERRSKRKRSKPSWADKRAAYEARLMEEGGAETAYRLMQAALNDAETLKSAQMGLVLTNRWLADKLTPTEDGVYPRISTKEIADISSSALNWQRLARQALAVEVSGLDPELKARARSRQVKPPADVKELTSRAKALLSKAKERGKLKEQAIKTLAGDETVSTLEAEIVDDEET